MVKKIKKYLKFVVCCALIMSLVAPSYAALSASDGSAFVTKAEFDAALADFNSRLTTFEAGINSKIDSQVTSYLDRNGIWNGKVFAWNCSKTNFTGDGAGTVSSRQFFISGNNVSFSVASSCKAELDVCINTSLPKSGLIYMVVQESIDFDFDSSSPDKSNMTTQGESQYMTILRLSWFLNGVLASEYWHNTIGQTNNNNIYNIVQLFFCQKGDVLSAKAKIEQPKHDGGWYLYKWGFKDVGTNEIY